MKENPIVDVFIEISGICNAKCPWCITGCGGHDSGKFMSFEVFCRAINRLSEIRMICSGKSMIHLYNWGEPTLNKDIDAMLTFLGQKGYKGYISTNAIKSYLPSPEALTGLGGVTISISGMTESSTKLIHGASETEILNNIEKLCNYLKENKWAGNRTMSFHIYQHNLSEITMAVEWCSRHNLHFNPYFAYFNNYYMAEAFLAGKLDYKLLEKASKQLMLFYVGDLIRKMPAGWKCPIRYGQLVLDPAANVLTCCALPWNHKECVLGSVFDMSPEQIETAKSERVVCDSCQRSGLVWWATHSQGLEYFDTIIRNHYLRTKLHSLVPANLRKLYWNIHSMMLRARSKKIK